MSITQTIEVPADHRLTIDLPRDLPVGTTARFEYRVIPFVKKKEKTEMKKQSKLSITRKELDEMIENSPLVKSLTGILHTNMTIEQIRDERLAKHLK
jgi:hypothetical protein